MIENKEWDRKKLMIGVYCKKLFNFPDYNQIYTFEKIQLGMLSYNCKKREHNQTP